MRMFIPWKVFFFFLPNELPDKQHACMRESWETFHWSLTNLELLLCDLCVIYTWIFENRNSKKINSFYYLAIWNNKTSFKDRLGSIHNLSRGWAMMISLFFPFIFLKPPLIISEFFSDPPPLKRCWFVKGKYHSPAPLPQHISTTCQTHP